LTGVELTRVVLFDRPVADAVGVYGWELAPAEFSDSVPERRGGDDEAGLAGAPQAPSGLSAVPMFAGRVELTWNDNSVDELGFKLQRSRPDGVWVPIWIGGNRSSYSDRVSSGTTYCYRIRSYNSSGYSVYAYASPNCVVARDPVPFRWTSRTASLLEPVRTPTVTIPVFVDRPDLSARGISLTLSVAGRLLDRVVLQTRGWHLLRYYLPPLIADEVSFDGLREGVAASGAADARVSDAAAPTPGAVRLEELTPWAAPPGPSSIWFGLQVDTTMVPARDLGGGDDYRQLGIGLGELQWAPRVSPEGIGFYDWEEPDEGPGFRWTRMQASQPLRVLGGELVLRVRADHPDIQENAVHVRFFWNGDPIGDIALHDRSWQETALAVGASVGTDGVLSVRVDRVWSPVREGVSQDPRALGVALAEIQWR
jgi:hypothetical protein